MLLAFYFVVNIRVLCIPSQFKNTPLHWAARDGNSETITALLNAGADLELADEVSAVYISNDC